ncbi:BamA/TamA family outer membrane protein [Pseudobacteriovorax antillogorgiicola]|uniref:BamA/TamA family outer membrane protein n=1 Tax=Pseudobacteriovorax antillogorgiicola TaxID=1513793 RepID=UPI001356710E|nr:BamA/TamA family outer membrane protein [Pseudobacteriovorax antillogorgiicola]
MKTKKQITILLMVLLATTASYSAEPTLTRMVCPGISIKSKLEIELTVTEKELVCDTKGPEAWRKTSLMQKEYFLTNFLQTRGYYNPKFVSKNGAMLVDFQEIASIDEVELVNNKANLQAYRFWKIYGRPMTPQSLDQLESWIRGQYGQRGYPCLSLRTKAFPRKGLVQVEIQPGDLKTIDEIDYEKLPGTIAHIGSRYYAFKESDTYDASKLQLSAQRMIEDELVISTNFVTQCEGETFKIAQKSIPGEPRLVTVGLGFDTEEYGIAELRWKNTRFTTTASKLDASLRASYRVVSAELAFDWYYAPIVMRHYLRSAVKLTRTNEDNFESRVLDLSTGPSWDFDSADHFFSLWPSLSMTRTKIVRGEGLGRSKMLSLRLQGTVSSHDHQLHRNDPRSGFDLGFTTSFAKKGIGSDLSINRYGLRSSYLANIMSFDPPIWIMGLRGSLSSTVVGSDTAEEDVPDNLKQRLGGTRNLRGFGRNLVAEDGALLSAYAGLELRLANTLAYGIQPIVFLDFGKVGEESWKFDQELYWGPGFGVHWKSPIGPLRATLARGFVESADDEKLEGDLESWQVFLSLGEQF